MSLVQSQWKFIEKAIQTKDGRDAVALVALYCVGDKVISVKLVSVRVLTACSKAACPKLKAPSKKEAAPVSYKTTISKVISPYFDPSTILVTQSPRAPARI